MWQYELLIKMDKVKPYKEIKKTTINKKSLQVYIFEKLKT